MPELCLCVQVGLYNGTIEVFNVSIASNEAVLDSWSVHAASPYIIFMKTQNSNSSSP